MRVSLKKSTKYLLVAVLVVFLVLGFAGLIKAVTTAVDLGTADSFGVLAGAGITNTGTTTVTGDVGSFVTTTQTGFGPGADSVTITGTNHFGDATTQGAKTALATAYTDASGRTPFVAVTANSTDSFAGIGTGPGGYTLAPGVYRSASTMGISAASPLILDGGGDPNAVFIFQAGSSLTTATSSVVQLTGQAQACNVFWTVGSSATLGTTSTFIGTVLADQEAITVGGGSTITGRILASIAAITLNNTQITKPTCSSPTPTPTSTPTPTATPATYSRQTATINVVKTVINDNGGTKVVSDFPLFVNNTPVISGVTNNFAAPAPVYTVTETGDTNYTRTFSGDCDSNGQLNLNPGENKFCIVTNNDIGAPIVIPPVPPLIDVVKTASPLSLPAGPGPVVYTYTLRNIGTVPVTNITMVGDTCSPIILTSGDTNSDSKLGLNEAWVYHCSWNLAQTHTNTIVATGWANGISAVDIASATVVVGAPIVPPLIHVVKVPSTFTLPAPGGTVTYMYTVTNPGTAPLSDVDITDDKCTGLPGRVVGHPGDLNHNDLLESNESWSFTCKTKLTKTTINTGTAQGSANGLTARDLALATVVVADVVPKLPNTGIAPDDNGGTPWNVIIPVGIFVALISLYLTRKKLTA